METFPYYSSSKEEKNLISVDMSAFVVSVSVLLYRNGNNPIFDADGNDNWEIEVAETTFIGNEKVKLEFSWGPDTFVALSKISSDDFDVSFPHRLPLVELLAAGRGSGHSICNRRLVQTSLGEALRFVSCEKEKTKLGKKLIFNLKSVVDEIGAVVEIFLPDKCSMFRQRVTITNLSKTSLVLESVTSFNSTFGFEGSPSSDPLARWSLLECHNDWLGEGRWEKKSCRDILPYLHPQMVGREPQGAYSKVSEGTFSTGTSAPLAFLSQTGNLPLTWAFQVENNGAWRWEIGDGVDDGYFSLSGPDYRDHGWSVVLDEGERFTSVPASAVLASSWQQAVEELTHYRRLMSYLSTSRREPKVVFNDYMNTLNGDPTTEKLLPLIDSAAQVGAEIFCIDCGWYDDTGDWWPSVGEWKPSRSRFPGGLDEVIDRIKSKGMIPGLWLEPEVVGVKSPVAQQLPNEAFFLHHGQRVVEQQRYLLDFRNAGVIKHMNNVVDYLIDTYDIGYFKFDYNVMPGPGTTFNSDSAGDGLLEHNRAYRQWIKDLQDRHSNLVIESCSSGGMRTDFAQSSLFQLLSTSDQQDFRIYPTISSAAPLSMLPEQSGNWAYPETSMSDEEFVFATMNTLLGHFYLSGYLNRFSQKQIEVVKSAVKFYKTTIKPNIAQSVPFWPLGLPAWTDDIVSLGLRAGKENFVVVWSRSDKGREVSIPVRGLKGKRVKIEQIFPTEVAQLPEWNMHWDSESAELKVIPVKEKYSARLFSVQIID